MQHIRYMFQSHAQSLRGLHKTAFGHKYLLYTNVTISFSLSCFGDYIQQQYERIKARNDLNGKWNSERTRHMGYSGAIIGVICHYWYKYLDSRLHGRTAKIVVKKIILDQLICSPICIGVFFLTLSHLQKESLEELMGEVKSKGWRLYLAEWTVWPVAQTINFFLIPHRFRVLYDNSVSLGYDVYTSKVKFSD